VIWTSQPGSSSHAYFDALVRNLANGGSRRDFVRHSAGFAAVLGLSRVGLPTRFARPMASWFGVPTKCEHTSDCGDPCLICPPHKLGEEVFCKPKCLAGCTKCEGGVCRDLCTDPCLECNFRMAGEAPSCIPKCQAGCSRCENGECVDQGCKTCEVCFQKSRRDGTCQPVEQFLGECATCDPETGKHTNRCSECERCEKGQCVSNCPNRCEICDKGTCRKCDRPCEGCNDAGQCWRCDPECERCNHKTGECETACDGGFTCCGGKCINCCAPCVQGGCDQGASASCKDDAKNPACCGRECHDLDSDDYNCGSCSTLCRVYDVNGFGEHCQDGRCVCKGVSERFDNIVARRGGGMECRQDNHECCDGNCVDMASYQSDPKHCGKCVVECDEGDRCVKGKCVGKKRTAYLLVFVHRVRSEKLGVERSLTMKATIRKLDTPDAEGNTFAGSGSYEGSFRKYNPSCDNKMRTEYTTAPLVGKARADGAVSELGDGETSISFSITPLAPEQDGGIDAVLPVTQTLVLKGGKGQDSTTFKLQSDKCRGTLTHVTEWSVTRVD
jgi:hypothetical protein